MADLYRFAVRVFRSASMPSGVTFLPFLPFVLMVASCTDGGEGGGLQGGRFATLELDATYPEAFSYLGGVRELSDGTILAADPRSQVLVRLDMDAGTADSIGRQGAGPQEYDGPDRVFPLPGDSTLLVDLGNARLTVIDPEGTFVRWDAMLRPTEDGRPREVHPGFVDAAGNLYVSAPQTETSPSDTAAVHRIDRASWEETPVAWRWRPDYATLFRAEKRPMFVPHDDWAVGSDGRVAVVHTNGFSVDWYFPDGTVVKGPLTELETYPVGRPDMEAELENMRATGIFAQLTVGDGGVQSQQMTRGIPAGALPGIDGLGWPQNLPAFRLGGTLISPRGEAWVQRVMPVGQPARVEVFDDRGVRLGYVELPPTSMIIGFGAGDEESTIAYVTRKDDVGLVWLERYRVVRQDRA